MIISFEGKVAIVTGAGNGLGKSHALALAKRGAKVVVNDLGGDVHGSGAGSEAAESVVAEIIAAGGEAFSHGANVSNKDEVADMVQKTMDKWGRIDVLINNAGVLRDKSFAKMELDDFKFVMSVHMLGSVTCTKAVWEIMRQQGYGRIVMTTSSSGLYGNFGQANYGAAKMGLIGFMNTLCLEGQKYNIHVNAISPVAGTRMTEGLMPPEALDILKPEAVTAGVLTLCDEAAPNHTILCAGAGGYAQTLIYETEGVYLSPEDQTPERVRENMKQISDPEGQEAYFHGGQQTLKFLGKAGIKIG